MYESKIYQTAYYSKENVMPYNFDVGHFCISNALKVRVV